MVIGQSNSSVIYFGGNVAGEWQSAYSQSAVMKSWSAGEWHHVACAFSASENRMRFFLDGVLKAENNENHYWPPSATGEQFYIGVSQWGSEAAYWIDKVQILNYEADAAEIRARFERLKQPQHGEAWLSTETLNLGDTLIYQYTPSGGTEMGVTYSSIPYLYAGIPLSDPDPPSTLLPAGKRHPSTYPFNPMKPLPAAIPSIKYWGLIP
jgi:hypothetical protein